MADVGKCFKAYDVRGKVPDELDPELAGSMGRAAAKLWQPARVVLGHDARLSGPELLRALASGLAVEGVDVRSLGLCGTEEIYHAAATGDYDLGIMVTGSHNPADENGFKLVRRGALPIGADSGLAGLARMTAELRPPAAGMGIQYQKVRHRPDYLRWLINFAQPQKSGHRLKIVINAGNGSAGPVLEEMAEMLPWEIVPVHFEPDGNFPHGIPNPLLPESRADTARAVLDCHADVGVAFDGDFDRCFFFDERGGFVEGYYLVGFLAARILARNPGGVIIHDPRLYWNTRETVLSAGGKPVMGRTGHAFMKETMRRHNAVYGGEMSAHHYYRDFAFCDSGMATMLLVLSRLAMEKEPLSALIAGSIARYPCSGEINFKVGDPAAIMERIRAKYAPKALSVTMPDGLNMEFAAWRFNLRSSNTEPLLRLNVESRGDIQLMHDMTEDLKSEISKC